MNLYRDALEAAHAGLIAILITGVDTDGDRVLCLSKFKPTRNCGEPMFSLDPSERAAFLLGCTQAAREGLAERHGVTFQ